MGFGETGLGEMGHNHEARLATLRLWSLEERRNRLDLTEVYKMMHGYTDVPVSTLLDITAGSCTRGHGMKMVKCHCHTDLRLYFFSNRVVSRWNTLSHNIVSAPWCRPAIARGPHS